MVSRRRLSAEGRLSCHEPSQGVWAVLGALPEELGPLAKLVRERRAAPVELRSLPLLRLGRVHGRAVVVAATGAGRRNAERGLAEIMARMPIERVIVLGVSGALSPGLSESSVLLVRSVHELEGGATYHDPRARELAARLSLECACAVTSSRLVCAPREKRALSQATPLKGNKLVDLETATYVRGAERARISWSVLRAVSDPVDEALPELLNDVFEAAGSFHRSELARRLLLRPGAWPPLLRLRLRVRRCAVALRDACCALLCEDPGAPRLLEGPARHAVEREDT